MRQPAYVQAALAEARRLTASTNGSRAEPYPEPRLGDAYEGPVELAAPGTNGTGQHEPTADPWPSPPADVAYHGLAGEMVRAIEPQSEADPVALLIQILVGFGNCIGRSGNFPVEGDRHFMNLYATLVGDTAKARKGTSWGRIRRIFEQAEPDWTEKRIMSGLSSGEGLVWHVRDPIMTREKVKNGGVTGTQEVESDPGEPDKRLLVQEPEFAVVLRQIERHGNTLSTNIRQAWDRGDLGSLTKNSPVRATGAHISIVGHITTEELRRTLSTTEAANGFANRFLWVCVRRSKLLPDGGGPVDLAPLIDRLKAAIEIARTLGEIYRSNAARKLWHSVYPQLSAGKPGLVLIQAKFPGFRANIL